MTDTVIQHKHGTAANLAAVNPTPALAEICIETDTGKMKIGDGETGYNDLDYAGGSSDWGGIGGAITDQHDLTGYEGPATYTMNTQSDTYPNYDTYYLCSSGTTLWSTKIGAGAMFYISQLTKVLPGLKSQCLFQHKAQDEIS